MGRHDVGRDDRPGLDATPGLFTGTTFIQHPFVSPLFGRRPRRVPRTSRSLALAWRLLDWRHGAGERTVTCIACGDSVPREDAREYDKHGDRFERGNKRFEHVCKCCHGEMDHKPRRGLEEMLVEFEALDRSRETFLEWYCDRVEQRYGPLDDE